MKVFSPLVTMNLTIGSISRVGNCLVIRSGADSSIDARVVIPPGEVYEALWAVLKSPSALWFVIALPFFWLRHKIGGDAAVGGPVSDRGQDINKPW